MKHATRAADELSRALTRLLLDEPFLGHLLTGIARRIDTSVPTAGVTVRPGGRIELVVNPDFLIERIRRIPERIAIVKHEVLHLLLRHLFRRDDRDPQIWNVACDLVVNQLVRPWPLPEGALTLATFPELALPPNVTADAYYDLLHRAGVAMPDDADVPGDHGGWGALTDTDALSAQANLERLVRQTKDRARGWSNLPDTVRDNVALWLDQRAPKLDWRRVVRMFAASSRRTAVRDTLRRPSRRFGTLPGHKIRRFANLVVAVDTSGSIGRDDFSAFFAEIRGLWRAGADLTIVECDAAVHKAWRYRGEPPEHLTGRGGTAFDPVFEWMTAQSKMQWDGVIYLTDAQAPRPTLRPRCPLLWVVTGTAEADLPGRMIRLTEMEVGHI